MHIEEALENVPQRDGPIPTRRSRFALGLTDKRASAPETLLLRAVWVRHAPDAVHLALLPGTRVPTAVWPGHGSLTVLKIIVRFNITPFTFVFLPIWPGYGALAGFAAVSPFTGVLAAFLPNHGSRTGVDFVFTPLADDSSAEDARVDALAMHRS